MTSNFLANKTILVTGGTGSFGSHFVRTALDSLGARRIVVFSRDELKQHEMRANGFDDPRLRWFIGDVRDADRIRRAFQGVDVVVHAAALKQVPACEYNPNEAIATNVTGTRNVIEGAIDCGVSRVMLISTDKACAPVNLYGATKMVAEKLIVQSNSYSGGGKTKLSCVRYGNVVGSRGSVVPIFLRQRHEGRITVTDPRMTRFWITLDEAIAFVVRSIDRMVGGEVFVPKLPSTTVPALAEAIAPGVPLEITGIRPGEKLHETMITSDESRMATDLGDSFLIRPQFPWWTEGTYSAGTPMAPDTVYASDVNDHFLSPEEIRALLRRLNLMQDAQ